MAKTFYAILPLPESEKNPLSEEAILKALRSSENQDLLFFGSERAAAQYCHIANEPKFVYDHRAEQTATKNGELPFYKFKSALEEARTKFYQPMSATESILLSHQEKKSFAILEVEIDDQWRYEHTHYVISRFRSIPNDYKNQTLITLSKSETASETSQQFQIECHKKPGSEILSLKSALIPDKKEEIKFSPQHKKLTLLRDYAAEPDPSKLASLQNIISSAEIHKLFGVLIEEQNAPCRSKENLQKTAQQVYNATFTRYDHWAVSTEKKLQLVQDYVLAPDPKKLDAMEKIISNDDVSALFGLLAEKQKAEAKNLLKAKDALFTTTLNSPPMSRKWKIAIGCSLGLAAIGYVATRYIQNHYDKNLSTGWKITLACTLGLAAIAYVIRKKEENPPIEQKEFNLSEIQRGMYKFWHYQATLSNRGGKSSSEKARSYESETVYRERLQKKQKQEVLSLNGKGELRKKVEFKDNNKVVITGTQEQIHRLSLYAAYSKETCKMTHEQLGKDISKSNSRSSGIYKMVSLNPIK